MTSNRETNAAGTVDDGAQAELDRTLSGVFGPNGVLERDLAGYEARAGQLAVAGAVERALADDGVLLCEAGTGIGKTFAYLVPALLSGRKVIVSTATRTLQEQIFHRDLPLIQGLLGTDVPVALMKGLPNYLCRRRYAEQLFESSTDDTGELRQLSEWVQRTTSGDLSELGNWQEDAPLRRRVASSADTRIGPGCAYFEDCFVTRMRKEAQGAQLVVVNHHLFFADLALRGPHPGHVLPDYDAVILDEAHRIEDVAATFFGTRVRSSSLERLLAEVHGKLARRGPEESRAAASLLERTRQATRSFFSSVATRAPAGSSELDSATFPRELKERYFEVDNLLADLAAVLGDHAEHSADAAAREPLNQLARRLDSAR